MLALAGYMCAQAQDAERVSTGFASAAALQAAEPASSASGWIQNDGQWDSMFTHAARVAHRVVRLGRGLMDVILPNPVCPAEGTILRLRPRGSLSTVKPVGSGATNRRYSFILGDVPSHWVRKAPAFSEVDIPSDGDGVCLAWDSQGGDLALHISAKCADDLANLEFDCDGVEAISESSDGGVCLETAAGCVRLGITSGLGGSQATPGVAAARWVKRGTSRIGLALGPVHDGGPVVVNAGLEWSTFLGGSVGDEILASASSPGGGVVLAGLANSFDFPTTPGAFDTSFLGGGTENTDAFVTVLPADGSSLVYSTFLGGNGSDEIRGVAVLPDGRVLVGGWTTSNKKFPITPGAWDTQKQSLEGFVARFSPDGSTLERSTYIGGSAEDEVLAVGVGPDGDVYVGGDTKSADGLGIEPWAWDPTLSVAPDGFVMRLDSELTTVRFGTYIGGTWDEFVQSLAVTPIGDVVIGGFTASPDFPVTPGCFQSSYHGATDCFVARITGDGKAASFVTYLGGSGQDNFSKLALFHNDDIAVLATTFSPDYPTTPSAFSPVFLGQQEGVVTRLDATGHAVLASTFVGGDDYEEVSGLDVSDAGVVTVAGETASQDLAVSVGAFQPVKASPFSGSDLFVWQLDPGLATLIHGTYLGGSSEDGLGQPCTVVADELGAAVVTGFTASPDFPVTPGSFDQTLSPPYDTVVAKLSLLPVGVTRYGDSTPGCSGELPIGATSSAVLGGNTFALTCAGAPADSTRGYLVVGTESLATPVIVGGAALWVAPSSLIELVPVTSDAFGFSELTVRVPADPALAGLGACVQYFWNDRCAAAGWSASNALNVRLVL